MTTRVRWGILGTATIAREAVIPGMRRPPYDAHLEIAAIASRSLSKAQSAAQDFGIGRAYGTYEDLLADPDIDAVYIPLPNHLHVPYSLKALEAGKHVLCEKPIALSADEARDLTAAARQYPRLKVMEAFMYRHHPQWQWARRTVDGGRIGPVQTIHSFFSFHDDNPASILHRPEWGGGALMDIGCYSVSLSRFLFGSEPQRVMGAMEMDPEFGVDRLTSGILEFNGGVSTFTCTTRAAPYQRVHILGTRGRIEIKHPFNPPHDRQARAWMETESGVEEIRFEFCDQYGIQADLMSRAILADTTIPTPIEDAVLNMVVIDALVQSGRTNGAYTRPDY